MRGMSDVLLTPREGACAHGQLTLLNIFFSRSPFNALRRMWACIHIGRRDRALERYDTGLPIGLELPMQHSATGATVGAP